MELKDIRSLKKYTSFEMEEFQKSQGNFKILSQIQIRKQYQI